MAGQIIPKGKDTWLVRVYIGRDSKGKRSYWSKQVQGGRREAQACLNEKLHEKDKGTLITASRLTLDEYLDQWEQTIKHLLQEGTWNHYIVRMRLYVRPQLGSYKLSAIKPLHVQAIYDGMYKRGLSAGSIKATHIALSSAFRSAVQLGLLSSNPAAGTKKPSYRADKMRAFTADEASTFLRAAQKHRYGIIFTFAALVGARPEEYLGLKWQDLDWERGAISIQRALIRHKKGGGWFFGQTKTASSRRQIPLPASLLAALRQHKRQQAERRLKAGAKWIDNDLIFTSHLGTPVMSQHLGNAFKSILKEVELPTTMRLYDLRHSCASLLLAHNISTKVVAERLGHSSVRTTLDTYAHVLPGMQEDASEKLERLLKTGTPSGTPNV